MPCKICSEKPVINLVNNNIKLCKTCFNKYFEKKVLKAIRIYDLLDDCKIIGVAVSGGKNSLIVLSLLNKIIKERISKDIRLIALHIDENIKDYSEANNKTLRDYCKKNNIELKIYSIKDEFPKIKDISFYGSIIRHLLNKRSRELKIERLATGHNLDSEAQTIIMNQLKNNIERSSRLGIITTLKDKRFIPRIKPLYFILESEAKLYAELNNIKDIKGFYSDSFRDKVKNLLDELEARYSGTKNNIINSFLEILPNLKEKYKTKIKDCRICGAPCSQDICNICKEILIK